jgi:hypothetical protein
VRSTAPATDPHGAWFEAGLARDERDDRLSR